jgi:hypothetical protein
MIEIKKSGMSLQQLQTTPEYKRCSLKHRFFITTLLASLRDLGVADQILATQSAYGNEGESARCMSYAILKTQKVRDVIAVYENYGKSAATIQREAKQAAREQYIETVKSELDSAKPGSAARARLVELYGTLMFQTKISKSAKQKLRRKS